MESIVTGYQDYVDKHSDPRVQTWPLMSSLLPNLLLISLYIAVVKYGPKLMEKRKPMELKRVVLFYNVFQIFFSALITYRCASRFLSDGYSLWCQPVHTSDNYDAVTVWFYHMSKIIDFADSIFFVLRKKNEHLSVLHVYHHGSMPITSWVGTKFGPGGHTLFPVMLNSLVHVVMYTYYFLAALGPEYRKFIWWKRYVTQMQLVQFILIFCQAFQVHFRSCNYPKLVVNVTIFNAVVFFILFSHFYVSSYSKQKAAARHKLQNKKL